MSEQMPHDDTPTDPTAAPVLEVIQGENVGEVFTVAAKTRIGRERDNDVILLDLKSSRYHAQILLEDEQWVLSDLGSANGTFLNSTPLTTATSLKHGDQINIGETNLIFKLADTAPLAADTRTTPLPEADQVPRRAAAAPTGTTMQDAAPSRLVWIIGGAIAVLCLVAVVVVITVTRRVSNGSSVAVNVSPPPVVASPETSQGGDVGSQDTQASHTPAGSALSEGAADLVLAYEDDFSDSFGGWDDAFDEYTRKVYGNNRYQIEVNASNLVAWGLANREVANFEIEVEARQEDGDPKNSYGLIFRFQDRENFYRYDISGDGYYLLSKFTEGNWETLVDWTQSDFINPSGQVNILRVAVFGPKITLWVNGQQLVSLEDDSLGQGNFGFFAGTFSEPYTWVSFDNLNMWTLPDEPITLIPTSTPPGVVAVAEASTPLPTPIVPSPTPVPTESTTLVEGSSSGQSPIATPTAAPSPTATSLPTVTPVPLPEYVSRDQTLGRGEAETAGSIVFPVFDTDDGVYDIYMADIADGENLTMLQGQASQPALTPDGSEISYRSWQPDMRGLFARGIDENPENAWGFDLFFESARPQFSPMDSSLMYHSRSGGKDPAVYRLINGVGSVMRREGFPIQGRSAKWAPNGQQFVYSSCLGSICGIILSNIDGSAPTQLTDNPADTNAEISPDGEEVVFMSNRAGNWEIYRVDIDGSNLQALTTDKDSDGLPTWSPDGSKIAFVSNRDGEWSVWTMNADGSNKRRHFTINGAIDGVVQHDSANSFGWIEENIDWVP